MFHAYNLVKPGSETHGHNHAVMLARKRLKANVR